MFWFSAALLWVWSTVQYSFSRDYMCHVFFLFSPCCCMKELIMYSIENRIIYVHYFMGKVKEYGINNTWEDWRVFPWSVELLLPAWKRRHYKMYLCLNITVFSYIKLTVYKHCITWIVLTIPVSDIKVSIPDMRVTTIV